MMETNLAALVKDLRSFGMTQRAIAEAVGSHQANISRLENGRQARLSFDVGQRLIALHKQRARKRAA